ncbi:hypothetical protein AVEN_70623-1 [Araneus ventricosus]|uniref:Uncharacterized protein n=1 Tax=Araneus ventricosus TaxID=182803 RepID=A0A4Y2UMN2_ARAVE|nr:hypothetical protein AVEN_149581-1 [Araneus ventricosus]GBO13924.1 hypothetical protein AVEN_70623-1 [Araneus ventricosus]
MSSSLNRIIFLINPKPRLEDADTQFPNFLHQIMQQKPPASSLSQQMEIMKCPHVFKAWTKLELSSSYQTIRLLRNSREMTEKSISQGLPTTAFKIMSSPKNNSGLELATAALINLFEW